MTQTLCNNHDDYRKLAAVLEDFFDDMRYWESECECCGAETEGKIKECPSVGELLSELRAPTPDLDNVYDLYVDIDRYYNRHKYEYLDSGRCALDYDLYEYCKLFKEWFDAEHKQRKSVKEYIKNSPKLFT